MTAQRAAPTRSSWHKTPAKIKRTSSSDSTSSTLAKEKRQRLRKLKRARSRTTFTDLIGLFEKQDDDIEKELLDDMRSNKFPAASRALAGHGSPAAVAPQVGHPDDAHDLLRDDRDAVRAGICQCGGVEKNYTPFPNKFISASRRVETPSRHRCMNRVHLTMKWVVSGPNLSRLGPRRGARRPRRYTGLFITNWTVNLLFIVDIVFNFLTAVYDPQLNKWLLRFDQIALHYARVDDPRYCFDVASRVHDRVQTSLCDKTVASLPADEARQGERPRSSAAVRSSSTTSPSTLT